ncbi:MAG: hypothetical protein MJZ19_05865 [Paludibacteraceae bacterium]|nr:hypothetical protein [Paludibacteraceae bacterium]
MWDKVDMAGYNLSDNGFYDVVGDRFGFINGATAWVAAPMTIEQWNSVCLYLFRKPYELYSRYSKKRNIIIVRFRDDDDIYVVLKVHPHYIYVLSFSELGWQYPDLL